MNIFATNRCISLALLLIKEQLKEPIALFWIIISPAAIYYLLSYSKGSSFPLTTSYIESASWFLAYISSSVAFFGFSFYIIGRRESGFIRSFIYTHEAKLIFLLAQFLAYSLISLAYGTTFYILTYFSFGSFELPELLIILSRFYICFVLLSITGILLSLLPINFQNASTIFSIASFIMLALGILSTRQPHHAINLINTFNPLWIANKIMGEGIEKHYILTSAILLSFILVFFISLRFLRINPVWSRY
jgi:ABC-2 type transport system permease protein